MDDVSRETDAVRQAGLLAIAEAERLFNLDVFDPPKGDLSPRAFASRKVIGDIITAAGWTWEVPYKGDGQVEWCGLFAGACWKVAGLDPKWIATYFASTYRLDVWARYQSHNSHPNPKPQTAVLRQIVTMNENSKACPIEPQAGDILMIGDGKPHMGDHICLVDSYDPVLLTFETIEGNGVGLGPDGRRRQGIVRGKRKVGGTGFVARRLIRPAAVDLVNSKPTFRQP